MQCRCESIVLVDEQNLIATKAQLVNNDWNYWKGTCKKLYIVALKEKENEGQLFDNFKMGYQIYIEY